MKRIFLVVSLCALLLPFEIYANNHQKQERCGWDTECVFPEGAHPYHYFPLYGDIDSMRMVVYDVDDYFGDIVIKSVEGKYLMEFNNAGDVTSLLVEEGNESWNEEPYKLIRVYDKNGKPIMETKYRLDGTIIKRVKLKYDSFGNCTESAWYKSDGSLDWKCIQKYDSSQRKIEEYFSYPDEKDRDWWIKYEYDSYGNQIEERQYRADQDYYTVIKKKYNSLGKIIERRSFSSKKPNDASFISHYTYNSFGKLVHYKSTIWGNLLDDDYYTYDASNNLIEYKGQSDKSCYVYDSYGNRIESAYYDNKGVLKRKTKYFYDSHNNIIKMVKYSGVQEEPVLMTEYQIIYRKQ